MDNTRAIGDLYLEANTTVYLARVPAPAGLVRAVSLYEEAIRITAATGDIEPAVLARSGLARARL